MCTWCDIINFPRLYFLLKF
ncbi:hypothetical protein [Flavobacterium lindanitolerans]